MIIREIKNQFLSLVDALNRIDGDAWADYYSSDGFISAMVGTDYYQSRAKFISAIKEYFSMRETQKVTPVEIQVTVLQEDLALMISSEKSEMQMKDGVTIVSDHTFSMLWKKEDAGWKIIHSHESWIDTAAAQQ